MNQESRTLWISLGAGLFAAFLLYSYSQEKKAEYDKTYGTMKNVVVAKQDISEMSTIDDSMLEVVQRPSEFVEPNAVSEPSEIIGQVAAGPIKAKQQITQQKLIQPGPDTGLAIQVAPQKRAITLPVNDVSGVSRLIRPGDRIDIYATVDSGKGANQKREVSLIFQNITVLATGLTLVNNLPRTLEVDAKGSVIQTNLTGNTNYGTVTLEVGPKEAQDLFFLYSNNAGGMFFSLRNPNDNYSAPRLPASNSDTVMGRPSLPDAPAAQAIPTLIPRIGR